MMAHTPGPWAIEDPFGDDTLAVVPAGKPTHEWVIIATCSYDDPEDDRPRITEPERAANARLIAAAPDMLNAIKDGLSLKGGWREAIVELEDHCSEPVRLKNMIAAADLLDRWADACRAIVKKATS